MISHWLDNAFLSGWGTDGGVVFRGNLSHFPFIDKSGAMDITFNTKDVLLDYQKNWPKLKNINAQVQFTEQGMSVASHHSKLFSAVSNNIHADIEYYLKPVLKLTGDIKTTIDDAVLYLQQSQLVSQDVVELLDAKDIIDLNLDITIPIENGQPDSKVVINFNDADYYPPGFERKKGFINHLKGEVIVHNQNIDAENLTANIMNSPAKVSIKTEKLHTNTEQEPNISLVIETDTSVKQLEQFELLPDWFAPVKNHLLGQSKIHLGINLPNDNRALAYNISSDFKGLSSTLPAPFSKQAQDSSPFQLRYSEILAAKDNDKTITKKSHVNIDFSDKISLALLLNERQKEFDFLKGGIALEGGQAKLPIQKKLIISGSLVQTPLDTWKAFFTSYSNKTIKKNEKKLKQSVLFYLVLVGSQIKNQQIQNRPIHR